MVRLLEQTLSSPEENLALDEALLMRLESAIDQGRSLLPTRRSGCGRARSPLSHSAPEAECGTRCIANYAVPIDSRFCAAVLGVVR